MYRLIVLLVVLGMLAGCGQQATPEPPLQAPAPAEDEQAPEPDTETGHVRGTDRQQLH